MTVASLQPQPNMDAADAILKALDIDQYRGPGTLKRFLVDVWHILEPGTEFVDGWVIDAICLHLEAVTWGTILRLVINIPPRHTKSTFLVAWRVWTWIQLPDARFLAASYKDHLALRDNQRVREIIEDPWFQSRFGELFKLAENQNAKYFFKNDLQGYHMAFSVAGSVTGDGGNFLVIDDPHSATEADSEADRVAALGWFRGSWSNRLNNQKTDRMVVIGQRIHDDDICGYILKERKDWTALILPSEFEPARRCITYDKDGNEFWRDPRTTEGELLWEARFDQQALDGLKRDLGSNGYSAQYQQSPVPAKGGTFKERWIRYFEIKDEYFSLSAGDSTKVWKRSDCWIFAVIDPAISLKQEADFTVLQIWACTPDNEVLLLAQVRDHLDNPEQKQTIESFYKQWPWEALHIETVNYQLALFQQLRKTGIPVREYKPVRDKVARASTAAIKMEAGDMYFLLGAAYLIDLISEILKFPKAAHDDQVDGLSMACDVVSNPNRPGVYGLAEQQVVTEEEVVERITAAQANPFLYAEMFGGGE